MAVARGTRYRELSDEEHVVRRCPYQRIDRDNTTGQILGIFPKLMELRQALRPPETYLSVNWLEHCPGTSLDRLRAILKILKRKMPTSDFSPESGLALMNVGRVRHIGQARKRKLTIKSTPKKEDPSYARISGMPLDNSDRDLLADLAAEASSQLILLKHL